MRMRSPACEFLRRHGANLDVPIESCHAENERPSIQQRSMCADSQDRFFQKMWNKLRYRIWWNNCQKTMSRGRRLLSFTHLVSACAWRVLDVVLCSKVKKSGNSYSRERNCFKAPTPRVHVLGGHWMSFCVQMRPGRYLQREINVPSP